MVTPQRQTRHPDYLFERLVEPDILDDPYPFYHRLRERARVLLVPTAGLRLLTPASHFCFISGHAEARQAMRELSAYRLVPPSTGHSGASRLERAFTEGLFSVDLPTHSRRRLALTSCLTPQRASALRDNAARHCDRAMGELTARLRDGEVADLHHVLAKPVAVHTLCDFIGVPPADRPALDKLVRRMFPLADPTIDEATLADIGNATDTFMAYHAALIAERRRRPQDDLVSWLVALEQDRRITQGEMETQLWTMWFLGFESTAAGIGNTLVQILRHPEHASVLADAAPQADALVAECLRREPSITMAAVARVTDRPLRIGDTLVPEDTDIRILLGAVNRDPDVFPDPDRFDPARDNSVALTFGHGVHRCIGVYLAKMEISVVLRQIHALLPGLRLAGEPVRRPFFFHRTFNSLPLRI